MTALSWRARIEAARSNRLLQAGTILVGGTAAAQALALLALPVLTRLYSPHDFQVVAVYSAALAILAVACCGRLEIAIPIARRDSEAANLLALAMLFAVATALLATIAILAAGSQIARAIGWDANLSYLWLFPAGILMSGSYAAAQYWATRRRYFRDIARTRVTQVAAGLAVQLGLGAIKVAPLGLLLGSLLMSAAGSFRLWWIALKDDRAAMASVRPARMRAAFRRFRRFPIYSVPEALANTAGVQLPMILIASLVAGPEAGFLFLAMRAVGSPISLVGNAIGQAYLAHASEAQAEGTLAELTTKVVAGLARVGVGPLLFMGLVAPGLFGFAFGREWVRAGELVSWMTAWSIFRLLSSPVSMVMHVRMAQRAMLLLTIFGLVVRLAAVVLAGWFWNSATSETFAVGSGIFYAVCYFVFCAFAGLGARHHWQIIRASVPLTLAAALTAGCLHFMMAS
jgi:O-antigen/teichoic acid export membrane protein